MSYLFDQANTKKDLAKFFKTNQKQLQIFGTRVNQTFEAYVFAKTIEFYKNNGWATSIVNPKNTKKLRLKFSTRGAPINFSYCAAQKGISKIQIRHQLRVDINKTFKSQTKPSNICCDIVVMDNCNINHFSTSDALPNNNLISFGEVKHMSAFAELVASFIGLVRELMPNKLKRIRKKLYKNNGHLSPFLYVSGILYSTAAGIEESVKKRKYDVDIYSSSSPM